ncbi:unnamed protein product [Cylicocyclus nassatus]|uniref:Uncharacterized protein n=1 Tax=Cylicocyclus nassatus TaxID=53992 RepID=A0AA36DRA3_CYLNA|nr:unnamed protein product [Cylicocyclus nassatus]
MRILWAFIRWQDMKPEDDQDPDRRIVSHFPDRDERRYRISIEVLPLDDEKEIEEEEDLSWTSGERAERRKSTRRKRPAHSSVQRVSHLKEERVDGVDLKLHEIYDHWKGYNEKQEAEKKKKSSSRDAKNSACMSNDQNANFYPVIAHCECQENHFRIRLVEIASTSTDIAGTSTEANHAAKKELVNVVQEAADAAEATEKGKAVGNCFGKSLLTTLPLDTTSAVVTVGKLMADLNSHFAFCK